MRILHHFAVRYWGAVLPIAGVILPRQFYLNLLYAVAAAGLFCLVLAYVRSIRMPAVRPGRGLAAVLGAQAVTLGTALCVTLEGLATWFGLSSPGKLIAAILLAAVAGQALQIDLGFLWWSDPLAQMNAPDPAPFPLLIP